MTKKLCGDKEEPKKEGETYMIHAHTPYCWLSTESKCYLSPKKKESKDE